MKKLLSAGMLGMLFLFSIPVQSQVRLGMVGGMNVTKVSFDRSVYHSDNRYGWFLGPRVYAKIPLVGLGLNAGAQYSVRRLNNSTLSKSKSVSTIEVPINVSYSVGAPALLALNLSTGPQISYNIGSKRVFQSKLRRQSASWNVGVSLTILRHIDAGVTYNIALDKFGKTYVPRKNGEGSYSRGFRQNSWQMQVAYLF